MASNVPQEVIDYLESQKTLTLATYGVDGPWAATLTYVNEGPEIYVWMRPHSMTAGHLEQNSRAAFAIDEYTEDWRQTKGIQGRGQCTPVEAGDGIARAADLFGQKYPQLRPGSTSAVIFFRIQPESLEYIDNTRGAEESDEFGAEFRRQSILDMPALG
jgi:nitroimidazol reductase NimA-like FMN-containing flavoprotein (pyridoxamine 5'-phosphate oxidase superfamily)